MRPSLLRRIAVDITPLRISRDFRLLELGAALTGLGAQMGLVALPYQVYILTKSPFLVGLIGLAELGPLVALALVGGAWADRMDRRRLLLLAQIALVTVAGTLATISFIGDPPVWALFILAGLGAGSSSIERVSRSSMVPNLVGPQNLRAALSFNFGLYQLTQVVGPALGGVVIAAFGVGWAYAIDAGSCLAMALAAWAMSPQPPTVVEEPEPVLRAIRSGLGFVRREDGLIGSFVVDLWAMTFGMPRALFPVLSVSVYHAGARGTGLLYAAVSAGATIAALTTGWMARARYLGRIVLVAVTVWGLAIAAAGLSNTLFLAALLFAVAGAADSVSAVCRSTISQSLTPDHVRGRMSSVFSLVVTSGPRLGDIESGAVASLWSTQAAVVSGGLACVAGVPLIAMAFPGLARYDGDIAAPAGAVLAEA